MGRAVDIEEMIVSTRYGLQGRLDATAHVELLPAIDSRTSSAPRHMLMPIEIKSGRDSVNMEHHMQVVLYSLLMPERYVGARSAAHESNGGVLVYLKTGALQGVVMDERELSTGAPALSQSITGPVSCRLV